MAALALGAYVLYMALAFGLRTFIQLRRTGSPGFEGISGPRGSAVSCLVSAGCPPADAE